MRSVAKSFSIVLLLAVAALSQTGCRMCCAPHDYTGPVVGCECQGASWQNRRGSLMPHYTSTTPAEGEQSLVADGDATPPVRTVMRAE